MTTYTKGRITLHLLDPVCLRTIRSRIRLIAIPRKETWLC